MSTYGSVEIARLKKMNDFDNFQFSGSAMVASAFEGLSGYGTLEYEGQVPTKPSQVH